MLIDDLNHTQFKPDHNWVIQYFQNYELFAYPEELTNVENKSAMDTMDAAGINNLDHSLIVLRLTPDYLRNLIVNLRRQEETNDL